MASEFGPTASLLLVPTAEGVTQIVEAPTAEAPTTTKVLVLSVNPAATAAVEAMVAVLTAETPMAEARMAEARMVEARMVETRMVETPMAAAPVVAPMAAATTTMVAAMGAKRAETTMAILAATTATTATHNKGLGTAIQAVRMAKIARRRLSQRPHL